MPHSIRPGDVLADRYKVVDLLSESGGGRFWRAHDRILERHVALHVIGTDDERATGLLEAARRSATVLDPRILRVLDADRVDGICYVVNEWGWGTSLDIMLANNGPLAPRRAAWLVGEVADAVAAAHAHGIAHGRLVPENVLLDNGGAVRLIGFCVDAALHGQPAGEVATDLRDLAGVLHAALTGKWAGPSTSAVPRAPQAHGRVLRPRQVRAGVPRPLDDLCDELLNPASGRYREGRDLGGARGIHELLAEFVGDPTGLGAGVLASNPARHETVVLPSVPEIAARTDPEDVEVEPEPEPEPEQEHVEEPAQPVAELPTQAGLPIFDDENDDVSWLTARSEPAPPPPPFEEPPERPLFAPDSDDDEAQAERMARRSHVEHATAGRRADGGGPPTGGGGGAYWPWDTGRGTGSGLLPVTEYEDDGEVPGRSWLRLAAAIATGLLLLVAIVVAYNLGRGKTPLGAEPDPDPGTSASAPSNSPDPSATPLGGLSATDFDPQANPPRENPDLAPLVVDGDDSTSWRTETYKQQLGPGGLKTGVGLVIDLGKARTVQEVDLTLVGEGTDVSLYLTNQAPGSVDDLEPVAQGTAGTQDTLTLDTPAAGRYLTVWLTRLPSVGGGFRGEVSELVVRG